MVALCRRSLVVLLAVLAVLVVTDPATAQWPGLGTDSDPAPGVLSPTFEDVARRAASSSLDALGRRLDLGPVDLGVTVAPRRPALTLGAPGEAPASALAPSRYRLGVSELGTTDIGLDLRLRWPTATAGHDAVVGRALEPYVSLGPAVSVPIGDEPLALGRPAAKTEPGMSLGVRGALGLTWRVAREASLFGEYRLVQDRPLGSGPGSDVGVDLFYGFSLRF